MSYWEEEQRKKERCHHLKAHRQHVEHDKQIRFRCDDCNTDFTEAEMQVALLQKLLSYFAREA